MDFLATPNRRRGLFAALYLSEGAPIGFIWLALPTWLRLAEVPIERITTLTALLVLPWTFKFAWAPLVDVLQSPRWTVRHWIVTAQLTMGATLLPLAWLDLQRDFAWIVPLLLMHAFSAATQDVAIDALCIATTDPDERGRLNGWMQAGMLLGRAMFGGGALLLSRQIGQSAVFVLLIAVICSSLLLEILSRLPAHLQDQRDRVGTGASRLNFVLHWPTAACGSDCCSPCWVGRRSSRWRSSTARFWSTAAMMRRRSGHFPPDR